MGCCSVRTFKILKSNAERPAMSAIETEENVKVSEKEILDLGKTMAKSKVIDKAGNQFVLKTAKGTRDRNPAQMRVLEDVFCIIKDCFRRHDAVSIDTPVFELKEVLTGKYGEDSKLIYNLEDQGGELLSLRYDLTVPFARYVAMNKIKTIKRYQIGKVYRRDQPAMNRGRFREFYQCDFDIAGDYGPMFADAECLRIVYEVLTELNLGNFVIKVNHRRFLDGIFSACGVPADKFTATCSSVDKLDKLPWFAVREELINEKGLPVETVELIGKYTQISGGIDVLDQLELDERLICVQTIKDTIPEMRTLLNYCSAMGIICQIRLDFSLARGLDYYTGVIYEAVLTGFGYDHTLTTISKPEETHAPKNKKKGKKSSEAEWDEENVTVGSVAGGGRYDNLVNLFVPGSRVPCVGVSFGIERLLAVRELLARKCATGDGSVNRATYTDVMVVVAHKGLLTQRLELCQDLWNAKIKTAFSHKNNPKLLDQLQYCESSGIPLAVIIGDGELQRGVVKLRRVDSREEREVERGRLIDELRAEISTLQRR